MECEEEDNAVTGRVPEFGAIFMANVATMKECFRQKIFGLPSSLSNFVKQVKAGMVLFLFEFERRELFGVYRASSDGAMNIVPHAFSSVGKQFPAQVRFTPIWYCSPLSENEFQDAIGENYFSGKKFNFGLSEDQVRRLLLLFSSKQLKTNISRRQFTRKIKRLPDKRLVVDDRFALSDGVEIESDKDYEFKTAYLGERPMKFPGTAQIMDDGVEDAFEVDSHNGLDYLIADYPGHHLGKRRRIEDDDWSSSTNVHPLGKVRRDMDDDQGFSADRLESVRAMVNTFGPSLSTGNDNPANFFQRSRGVAEDDRFLMRDSLGYEWKLDSDFGQVISNDHLKTPLGKVELANNGRISAKDSIKDECTMENCFKPEHIGNFLGKYRRENYAVRGSMDDIEQIKHHVDAGIKPAKSADEVSYLLGRIRRPIDNGRFLMSQRVETEHNLDVGQGPLFGNPLCVARGATDGRFSIMEHDLDERYVTDDGRFGKSDKAENGGAENYREPFMSTEYTAHHQSRKCPLPSFRNTTLETDYSLLEDVSYSTSYDAAVTRALPHDTEVLSINHRHSSSSVVDQSSMQEWPPYHGSENDLLFSPKSRSSFPSQPKGLRVDNVPSGYESKFPFPTRISNNNYSGCLSSISTSNAGYSENRKLNTVDNGGHHGLLFSERSSDFVPISKGEICEKEYEGPLAYDSGFSRYQVSAFNDDYHVVPRVKCKHRSLRHESNEVVAPKESRLSDANQLPLGIYFHENGLMNKGNASHQTSEGMQPDSKNIRTSVFARLSSAPVVPAEEHEENYPKIVDRASVDVLVAEVRDMLPQCQNHPVKKLRKSKPLLKQHDDVENATNKNLMENQVNHNYLTTETVRVGMDAHGAIEENVDQMPRETRVVDFKRRSETRKNLDGTSTKGSLGIADGKGSSGIQGKRQKLIRPVFNQKESCNESISCGSLPKSAASSSGKSS